MILLVDNYDSFTYNLYQYLGELGADVRVVRNDAMSVDEALALGPEKIVISPGPGHARRRGDQPGADPPARRCRSSASASVTRPWARSSGARSSAPPKLMHGKTSEIRHDGQTVFAGLPDPFTATRYHSLVVAPETVPDAWRSRPGPTTAS